MQEMIKTIMTIKTETAEDVYAAFDGELVEQITKAADAVIKKDDDDACSSSGNFQIANFELTITIR